jgi:Smg protein
MFDVLVYVYENFWSGDVCPELDQLGRKLSAAGFESDEIEQALHWLAGLNLVSHQSEPIDISDHAEPVVSHPPSAQSLRVYSVAEQDALGAQCLGFISFLESAGVMPAPMREIVIDRAMAIEQHPISLEDLKIIVLMVYWSMGVEPDALVLDELSDDSVRVAH